MSPNGRVLHAVVTVFAGVFAASVWGRNTFTAVTSEDGVSTSALFASLSAVLTGFALAAILSVLPGRARGWQFGEGILDDPFHFVLVGLVFTGMGADILFHTSPGAWDWTTLVGTSLVGGMFFGEAVTVGQPDRGSSRMPPSRPPSRYDWR